MGIVLAACSFGRYSFEHRGLDYLRHACCQRLASGHWSDEHGSWKIERHEKVGSEMLFEMFFDGRWINLPGLTVLGLALQLSWMNLQ